MSFKQPLKAGSIVATLDVGSSKIACFIARVLDDAGAFEIVGVGHHASQGIKSGVVVDMSLAEIAIAQSINAAEKMASKTIKGYPLRDVILAVSSRSSQSHFMDAHVQLMKQTVTEHDVRRALAKAQLSAHKDDREMVHTIPVDYIIDGHKGIQNPYGMSGQLMDIDIHMVDAQFSHLKHVSDCVEKNHLDVVSLCCAPYAAGLSTLIEDEIELGSIVIDMGAGVTSYGIFQSGRLMFAGGVPIGGQHITSDLAHGLSVSLMDAERLKTLYGSALATISDEHEYIDVPSVGDVGRNVSQQITRSLLINIIQARLEETFEMVSQGLKDSGVDAAHCRRVVLTGGASLLPGVNDLAQRILGRQVRCAQPLKVKGLPDATSGPAFAVSMGLIYYYMQRPHEVPMEIASYGDSEDMTSRFKRWFKENW